jgi:hypothetical protein
VTDDSTRVIRYFEDYIPGLVVDCGTFTIGEAELVEFAREYDPSTSTRWRPRPVPTAG